MVERLQKVLAAAGVASRRECEQLILAGRVQVDSHVVDRLGVRVDPTAAEIRVDGEVISRARPAYFAVHKPAGFISTARDPDGRPRVVDLLPPDVGRLYPVGRLDQASEGLILVTNDGALAHRLTHPRHGIAKVYQVRVAGHVPASVCAKLQRGVRLAEGMARAERVRIKHRRRQSTDLEIMLTEGRNREIRRLLARLGHKVQKLVRVAVGPIRLGDLPRGAVRPLTSQEISALRRAGQPSESAPPRRRAKGRARTQARSRGRNR